MHDGASSGCEHDADGEYDIDDRIDDIDCGQRIISKKARDKNPVRDCITGHEYHHDHGW